MLTDDQRAQVVYLKEVVGKTYAEIAQEMGLKSPGAVRGIYRRNRAQFDDKITDAKHTQAYIVGETAECDFDPAALWQKAIQKNIDRQSKLNRRNSQSITLEPPCAWAMLSDAHFGSEATDYKSLKRDAEIIRDTPNMHVGFHGDGVDNWIVGKLQSLERWQALRFDEEWQLFSHWLGMMAGKMLYVVAGNHDNWTYKISGVDRVAEMMRGTKVLYHSDQIIFDLHVGPKTYPVKVRHKWRGSSIFNVTHAIEVGWERGGNDFVIGIGGHTHIGTYCRPFTRHGLQRYAVLTGTYKIDDTYGTELGLASPAGRGAGAFVFDKAGQLKFFEDLEQAADYLEFLRK